MGIDIRTKLKDIPMDKVLKHLAKIESKTDLTDEQIEMAVKRLKVEEDTQSEEKKTKAKKPLVPRKK